MINRKYILISACLMLMLNIVLVSSEASFIKKQYNPLEINIPVYNSDNSPSNSSTNCNLTIRTPMYVILVDNVQMTFNVGGRFNHTLRNVTELGEYPYHINCDNGADYGFATFSVEVTPTGQKQSSILENPILIIFGLLALGIALMGLFVKIPAFGFIASIMFLMGGIYTMIYGINNLTDFYTQSVAIVLIGLGFIFMFSSAYEWFGGRDDE